MRMIDNHSHNLRDMASKLFRPFPLGEQSPTASLGLYHEMATDEELLPIQRPRLENVPVPNLGERESPQPPSPTSDVEIRIIDPVPTRRKRKPPIYAADSDDDFMPVVEEDHSPPPKKQKRSNKNYNIV